MPITAEAVEPLQKTLAYDLKPKLKFEIN